MKLTRHNGRAGKNGTYNPKHNDRSFNISNSEHINEEKEKHNIYWDCFNGYRSFDYNENESELANTFEEVEQLYYSIKYQNYIEGQNARNIKNRHPERNRTTADILKHKKTCPEETIYQIGTLEEHVDPDILFQIVTDFMEEFEKRFGSHVHILNWSLHLDESTPHIHERHVFDCKNQYGELFPQQEKALEQLGFELPNPDKPTGRMNNRKMVFDSTCRALLFDISKNHGLQLDEEPEYGGRKYLEKQDYILARQKEQLVVQGQKLEELVLKIDDVEGLIDEVADIAYEKAVEIVTDVVKKETHLEDIRLVEQSKEWVLAPERKASKKEKEYAVKRLDGVINKIKNAMQLAVQKMQTKLMQPEIKKSGTEQINKKARESILDRLERAKVTADQKNQEHQGTKQIDRMYNRNEPNL
ncbi:serine/arginine repetitive matrix protein 2 [Mediterraneibacter gnavus]|uniref:serine/arginine repetitive matrix protein 2 n=1 Tax=Mediterraneibacter gnavus TaxID=33038 RepID=UPI003564BC43